jgi:hypothetical protein
MNPWVVSVWTGYVLLTLADRAYASMPAAPEIDGTGAVVALGLLAGAVTLVAERLLRK